MAEILKVYGQKYKTVKIGDQIWMAENLNVNHYRNGDKIPQIKDNEEWIDLVSGAWCYYENKPKNGRKYGKLYNWYAVNDPRCLTPEGWHVPTDAEWKELEMYLGMSKSQADKEDDIRGIYEGGKLKEVGTIHWDSPNDGATNVSGFSALPGGYRGSSYGNGCYYMGSNAEFWSSTEDSSYVAWGRGLDYETSVIGRYTASKDRGFSVRLVRDN